MGSFKELRRTNKQSDMTPAWVVKRALPLPSKNYREIEPLSIASHYYIKVFIATSNNLYVCVIETKTEILPYVTTKCCFYEVVAAADTIFILAVS